MTRRHFGVAVTPAATNQRPHCICDLTGWIRRWLGRSDGKRLLESGRYGSLAELAAAEKIDRSYLARTLRLTLLAPDIVEAILNARQPYALALPALLEGLPSLWVEQRSSMPETGASRCAASAPGDPD